MREYYGPNWNKQREKRLEIDDYQCSACGYEQPENPSNPQTQRLQVHHKLPIRVFKEKFDEVPWDVVNDVENLVSLCHSCHTRAENDDTITLGVCLSGDVKRAYISRKPFELTDNEFIGQLLGEYTPNEAGSKMGASIDSDGVDPLVKRNAQRELQHDMREMIRDELEQFARKYF